MNWQRLPQAVSQHPYVAQRPAVKQFMKFAIVGVLNTTCDVLLFCLFVYVFHVHYLVANIFAFLGAAVNSYYFNRRWTFRSTDPRWHQEAMKFLTVLTIGFGLNEGLLYIFVEHGHIPVLLAKLIAILIVLIFNFSVNRWWTFRHSVA